MEVEGGEKLQTDQAEASKPMWVLFYVHNPLHQECTAKLIHENWLLFYSVLFCRMCIT
jgi:hypothetical protein